MVNVECLCPPTPAGETRHPDGDTIELHERLDFRSALTARNTIVMLNQEAAETPEIMAALTETYLLLGIASWSVVDAKGKAVEPNKATIREYLLSRPDTAMAVGDAADALYSDAVLLPLVARVSNSSPGTPTNGSTSRTNGSAPKRPKRSKPSSTSTTPTGVIVTTSSPPDGVSSSSQSSA
jgi:hypothetical protein